MRSGSAVSDRSKASRAAATPRPASPGRTVSLESLQLMCDSTNQAAAEGIRGLFRALARPRSSNGAPTATNNILVIPGPPGSSNNNAPLPPTGPSSGEKERAHRPSAGVVVIPGPPASSPPTKAPHPASAASPSASYREQRPIDLYHAAFKTFHTAGLPLVELYLQAYFGSTWQTDLDDPPRPWSGHSLVMLVNKKSGSIFFTFNKAMGKDDLKPLYDLISKVRASESRGHVLIEDVIAVINHLQNLLVKLADSASLKVCEKESLENWDRGIGLDPLLGGGQRSGAKSAPLSSRRTRAECEATMPAVLRGLRSLREQAEASTSSSR